ncbi:MAG: heat-inducible transcription repressor HrcA [Actinobacteria bacterium]|nr:heat-inducible transcription repressor HrcA [Actinomycetota bacterium]
MTATKDKLDDRKAAVLRAIVSQYVGSGEPVGSKTIVERFALGVSASTVRNDMGVLEEAGYIYQPHTSAGRVPTDSGYRYFVDAWTSGVKLSAQESRRIRGFFVEPRWELEDALRRTAALLSGLTDTAAVVFAPALDKSVVRHIDLVRLSGDRAMVLLVSDTGRVQNHVVLIPESFDDVQINDATGMLNRLTAGVPVESAGQTIRSKLERFPLEFRDVVVTVAGALDEELPDHDDERVFLEGAANILEVGKFSSLETVRQVIGALEHRRVLLEVLADALQQSSVSVRIGAENPLEEMQYCSVVTAPYGADGKALGSLGVVGPTRMDYRRTIATVHEVASSLGRMFTELGA